MYILKILRFCEYPYQVLLLHHEYFGLNLAHRFYLGRSKDMLKSKKLLYIATFYKLI